MANLIMRLQVGGAQAWFGPCARLQAETQKWGKVIRDAGVTAE